MPTRTTTNATAAERNRMTAMEFQQMLKQKRDLAGADAKPKPGKRTKAEIKLKKLAKDKAPNANEKRLLQWLKKQHVGCTFRYEAFTLRLPSGTSYTPDWTVTNGSQVIAFYEAKDSYTHKSARDSKAKFKEARATFTEFRFVFAQWNGSEYVLAE